MSYIYLGEGSYGCVIKPGIKCRKNIQKNTVSKFFSNKKAWLYEINNNKIINKILKKENIVKLIDYCPKNKKEKILIQNCKLINTKKKYLYNIIYEYGGIDLSNLKNIKFKKFFFKFDTIFETIKLLSDNNYIHFDVRLPNILYNKNKLKLIDYGLMKNKKEINKFIKKIKKYKIYYLPPEFNNLNLNDLYIHIINYLKYNKISKNKKKHMKSIINFLFKNIKNNIKKNTINTKKIDVYMIGIVLLELLIKNNLDLLDNEYNLILNYIKKLIDPDTYKRYDINEAYIAYKKLIIFIKK